ncbi:tetratricopeptide repeat protein [Vreelandella lutescens]|uniref:protein O-GlcNAc transferase n=1 Tax=Vreelandella lutescens TaxID=1602943 RepID=A0ABQ1PLL9_9GAMM|nr:CDP-glycerol glycerophosphotransferase family protein [Halomonas lutescens]GGC99227.1 hypothetical protein GCM10011382_32170 [Halomonas lutescens]
MARKQAKKNQSNKNRQAAPINQKLASMNTAFDKAYKANQLTQALSIAETITQQFPSSALGWVAKADTYARLKQFADAISCMQQIDKIMNQVPSAYQLKRAQYQVLGGQASEAIPTLLSLVKQQDTNAAIFSWLSQAYHVQGKNDLALEANDKAIQLDRSNVDTLLWRSRILDNLRRPGEAKEALFEVKKLVPSKVSVNNHLGSLAMREGEYKEAEHYFQAELSLQDNSQVFSNLIIAQHYNPENTAEQLKEIHLQWAKKYQLKSISDAFTSARPNKKIRLGLLSGGFRVHPVGQMVLPVLENLSFDEFELFVYSTNQVRDSITEKVNALASKWRVVENVTNQYLSDVIKSDGIDILLDMNGGGDGSRYQAISSKPTPLIVKWVGMQINTTGLDAVDYFLSDHFETPQGSDHLYSEKLIRLPDDYVCYQLPKYMPSVSSLPALGNQFITFGCLNNPAKLSPPLITQWAQLLNEVPGSQLLLRGIQFEGDDFKLKIAKRFSEQGIDESRLILEGPARHEQFLTTYQRIDIALDTWPYSGGLTTCEALAMGVPVVTCVGPTFAGRHSATHLANAGLPELVTDNWDDFRKRAKELASDLPNLAVIRAALRTILTESPICDGKRFAKHFTKAMRGIWQRHCEGKAPEALTFDKEGDAWFADEDQVIELVEVEAEPEPQEAEFEWNMESPITVIDNGALFARHPKFTEWMQTGNFSVITFDPGSLLTKQADELKQFGEWHHYPHATLGDGADGTLYATLDPELTGSLEPLAERQTMEQNDPLRVLSTLPISTIALDSIEGLPGIDVLVLDDLNDAMTILNNGHRYLENIILVIVKVSNKATHKKQANKFEIENWIKENGFRCYRSENSFPYRDNDQTETFFIFQSAEKEALLPKGLKYKLSYCWHLFACEEKMSSQIDGCHSEVMLSDKKSVSLLKEELVGKKFVHIRYPLIYGISLFDENVRNSAKSLSLEYSSLAGEEEIVREICRATSSDLVFTGHSFYNLSVKSAPYINENRNLFDLFGIVPFSIVDDHAYADFMLSRCKGAPEEIIMGSTSMQLLDEYEAVSVSKKVYKIKVPPKVAEKDVIPFEEKENRAVFLGKLYDNIPANLAILKSKIDKDTRLSSDEKRKILKMVEGRQENAFYSPEVHELAVSDLVLLYYDLTDKFFRNLYREKELKKIVNAFKKHNIPVHVIGGDKSAWAFEGKEYCVFWPKTNYKNAVEFLHKSKYNINLTPSYSDTLTGRAIDMMGSNSLCISDYTPYYEKLNKELVYFGCDFVASGEFIEGKNKDYARGQSEHINNMYSNEKVEEEWESCIAQAYDILKDRSNASDKVPCQDLKKENDQEAVSERELNPISLMHKREILKLKNKKKIRVVFLAIHRSVWKVDAVFQGMLRDPVFEPIVLVCPDLNKKNDTLTFSEMKETYSYFKNKGYEVFSSWMKNKRQWRSLDSLKPDLLFFTNPHGLTHPEYYDRGFTRFLSCYVPYTYQVAKYENDYKSDYNQAFHNAVWRIYAPHNESLSISRLHADNKGSNVVVTGYPLVEDLLATNNDGCVWKKQEATKKKIIWAPHHTISDTDESLPFSNFVKMSDFMLELSERYKDQVQWAFKPHPLLKEKLYRAENWGRDITDNYYSYWECSKHTQLEQGEYSELFQASDALIHDSVSFLAEYLVLDKPVLFVVDKDVELKRFMTPFGISAYNASHHGATTKDITSFVDSIVSGDGLGNEKRKLFLSDSFKSELFESSSRKIIDDLKSSIFSS